ncbi:MAG: glycosyltransferase family 4 protein [Myxococcota bacterium]
MPSADVLYVLRYWPTVSETFVAGEIAELQRQGVAVAVLSMGTRADGAYADGLPAVPVLHVPRGLALAPALLRRPALSKHSVRRKWAIREARALEVRRVHAHFAGEAAFLARDVARALDVPFSVTVHAADLFKPRPGLGALLREAAPCVTVCDHHRSWIARHHGADATVVRCGIDPHGRPAADPTIEPARVVCVARDVPKKGLDRLRRAVPPVRLDLVGAGAPVPPSRIPARLAAAQLFALPAQVATDGDRDGIPVAMMEAMAAGLPVVTRPVSGIPELVDETVGWIDVDFERVLREALNNPGERARRGSAGRERVRAAWTLRDSVRGLRAAWDRLRP